LISNEIGCLVTRDDWYVDEMLDQFDPGYHVRDLFVTGLYYWSPDGNYIVLSIDPSSPGSDDGAWATAAIVDSAGERLQLIRRGWLLADNPWRPAIVGSN
jgi:hypothetical protein